MRRALKAKLEYAKFLQKTLGMHFLPFKEKKIDKVYIDGPYELLIRRSID